MSELFRHLRDLILCRLARRDVVAADRADTAGKAEQSAKHLRRAEGRLKRASGLNGWPG